MAPDLQMKGDHNKIMENKRLWTVFCQDEVVGSI